MQSAVGAPEVRSADHRPRRAALNPIGRARAWLRHLVQFRLRGLSDPDQLVKDGLRLGKKVYIGPGTLIDPWHCWLVSIGDESVIAPRVHILAHDASTKLHLGFTKIGEVAIGKRVFVGSGTTILPNTRIGDETIIGAGSVVRGEVPAGVVAAGNPLEILGSTEDYIARQKARMEDRPRYPRDGFTQRIGITEENKAVLQRSVRDGVAFVE